MSVQDFEGINKFKMLICALILTIVALSIIGPLFFYEDYSKIFIYVQGYYFLKGIYFVVMAGLATRQGLAILKRVAQKHRRPIENPRNIYHAIVLPVYQESTEILKRTVEQLASHERAKTNYLLFLAMEAHSERPKERAEELLALFENRFRRFSFTVHKLQAGEAPGKASNENYCLRNMERVFSESSIDSSDVLFTTIDCDNLAP